MFQTARFKFPRLEHRHGDSWHEMHDVTPEHSPAESDPERNWARARIFRCGSCDDEVRVVTREDTSGR